VSTPEPPAPGPAPVDPHLEVTWDPNKAQSNLAKHGVSFAQAASVLLDALALSVYDEAQQFRGTLVHAGPFKRG
jgi:uncharacterized DUF497 family protein